MATAAAALLARARRDIASHFMSHNAVSANEAVLFEPDRRIKRRQFERMKDAGVVHETADGRFWMNLPAYDQWQRERRKRVGIGVGVGVAIAAAAALFAG